MCSWLILSPPFKKSCERAWIPMWACYHAPVTCVLACLDDMHFINWWPGIPVVAVEWGKPVDVSADAPFSAGDHDFTKARIIPSVILFCNVPEKITDSFPSGKVQLASRMVYLCVPLLSDRVVNYFIFWNTCHSHLNPILCLYADRGPDHSINFRFESYINRPFSLVESMHASWARTASHSSYRNPVERIMSLINLGLESISAMRQKMSDEMEKVISNANSMDEIWKVA